MIALREVNFKGLVTAIVFAVGNCRTQRVAGTRKFPDLA